MGNADRISRTGLSETSSELHLVGQSEGFHRARISSPAVFSALITSVFSTARNHSPAGTLRQADGTAWMAFYCVNDAEHGPRVAKGDGKRVDLAYEDIASKFFEHFVQITDAMNHLGGTGLWDEEDGFYYDQLRTDRRVFPLRTRSVVGLLPLIAVEVLEKAAIEKLPGFTGASNGSENTVPTLPGTSATPRQGGSAAS